MDAVCKTGSRLGAAMSVGKCLKTVETQLRTGQDKMRARWAASPSEGAPNGMQCLLAWDRWRQSEAANIMQAQP
jgi:hypothetical protein